MDQIQQFTGVAPSALRVVFVKAAPFATPTPVPIAMPTATSPSAAPIPAPIPTPRAMLSPIRGLGFIFSFIACPSYRNSLRLAITSLLKTSLSQRGERPGQGCSARNYSVALGWPMWTAVSQTVFLSSSMQYQMRPTHLCVVEGRLGPGDGASIDGRGRNDSTAVSDRDGGGEQGGEFGVAEDLCRVLPGVDEEFDSFEALDAG